MDAKVETIRFADLLEADENESTLRKGQIAYLTHDLLRAIGEDPDREGLRRTPERVARMYGELLSGYETDLAALVNGAIFESETREMILVRDIDFYSLCEHHMLPFTGRAHVAYIPDGKIIGLSKIPRLVEMYARRLQVQERMTGQIAETLQEILLPKGVAVLVEGAHLCAMMRGVKKTETSMVTRAFSGVFELDEQLRREFLASIRNGLPH
jgi:GTP cyclohydrolase I